MSTTMEGESERAPKRLKQSHVDGSSSPIASISNASSASAVVDTTTLVTLLKSEKWDEAIVRMQSPAFCHEPATLPNPSPLAIACRYGAPVQVVKVLLQAAPQRLRHVLDSRGTPLHEAIVCEESSVEMVDCLLQVDEALDDNTSSGSSQSDQGVAGLSSSVNGGATGGEQQQTSRATLLQDVDGFTPLHLLIRRRFQSHILFPENTTNNFLQHLERMVQSCPTAVLIPDCGEYQEPPIVYALKANIYAPILHSQDERVEQEIFRMVQIMLRFAPEAAGTVFCGFRGHYSALHSAVFHGRHTSTIQLLLETEAQFTAPGQGSESALLTNTQSELPLHFCAMRGERPGTVDILAKATPQSVTARDASGLTPFHWVWIRFVSTLLSLQERDSEVVTLDMPTAANTTNAAATAVNNPYKDFCKLEQGDFEADLQMIRKLDPPVDFLRMRHIPPEVAEPSHCDAFAKKSVELLERIRQRHQEGSASSCDNDTGDNHKVAWTRQEAVVSLFWTRAVSLLEAIAGAAATEDTDENLGNDNPDSSHLVHAAFSSPSCFPPIAFMAASLFPDEMKVRDQCGKLPIHHAITRPWSNANSNTSGGSSSSNSSSNVSARMLQDEALLALQYAIDLSPREAMRVADKDNQLPLHYAIDSFSERGQQEQQQSDSLKVLQSLVSLYPESLHRRDGKTKLFPFLQAAAKTSETPDEPSAALSISFALLRENPSILSSLTS